MSHASLLLVYTDIDPEREDEFNRWYDETHLPDLLRIEGIVGARRYKLAGPPPRNQDPACRYLAVYELATDDTRALIKRLNAEVTRLGERGLYPQMRVGSAATYVALGEAQRAADA